MNQEAKTLVPGLSEESQVDYDRGYQYGSRQQTKRAPGTFCSNAYYAGWSLAWTEKDLAQVDWDAVHEAEVGP